MDPDGSPQKDHGLQVAATWTGDLNDAQAAPSSSAAVASHHKASSTRRSTARLLREAETLDVMNADFTAV